MEKKVPRLRLDMDIVPTTYRGEKVFLVKDMLGLISQTILLKGEALQIIRLIDGKRDVRDIQMELIRMHGGVIIRADEVEEMISQLDRAFLLDSDHYRREKTRIIAEYGKKRNREAALAGKAYAEDPAMLASDIQSIFGVEDARTGGFEGQKIRALIAPHIDLDVGKEIYAKAYQVLRGFSFRKILVLGTGHNLQDHYFSLTTKDFITPLGRARTDRDSIERLKETCPSGIIAPHDIDHKNEHSLEFQILFLQWLFGDDFELIPVLCGSFHRMLQKVTRPADIPGLADFLAGLQAFLGENEGDVLVIAGVDLSHIGPKFGHREAATSLLLEAKAHDKSLIDAICRGDVTAFWSETQRAHNKYNVCGFSALALLLELLPGRKGSLMGYDFWMEEATQSAVSYAALAFFD